jgi:hypothetical protein
LRTVSVKSRSAADFREWMDPTGWRAGRQNGIASPSLVSCAMSLKHEFSDLQVNPLAHTHSDAPTEWIHRGCPVDKGLMRSIPPDTVCLNLTKRGRRIILRP